MSANPLRHFTRLVVGTVRVIGVMIVMAFAGLACGVTALLPAAAWRRSMAMTLLRSGSRALLWILGVRRQVRGPNPRGGALVVANHLSWLDALAVASIWRCSFVAKSEVRDWPIVGWLARRAGVVFVDRQKKRDLLRVITELELRLRTGEMILVFPEGTTSCGDHVLPFRSALFEAAVRTHAAVFPVAIGGSAAHARTPILTWTDDATLVGSLPPLAAASRKRMTIHIGAPIEPMVERKTLARVAHAAVSRRFVPVTHLAPGSIEPSPAGANALRRAHA